MNEMDQPGIIPILIRRNSAVANETFITAGIHTVAPGLIGKGRISYGKVEPLQTLTIFKIGIGEGIGISNNSG